MPNVSEPVDSHDVLVNLEPMGLVCGGHGTPLGDSWIDLSAPNQVFYGLNGAGKTTILESLSRAISGTRGGGQILARLPLGDDRQSSYVEAQLGTMLVGDEFTFHDELHQKFVDSQRDTLWSEFVRRRGVEDWLLAPGKLDWNGFLEFLAASPYWLFTPIGVDTGRWSASPVAVLDPQGRWTEHLQDLVSATTDQDAPLMSELGLEPLWWNGAPSDAPLGIVGTLIERFTDRASWRPWWPFGHSIADSLGDASELTRQHLATHPSDRWSVNLEKLQRSEALGDRVARVERHANLILVELLADAPALHLDLGDDAAWFAGRSCTWTATRFEGDSGIALHRLSSAEQRWAHVAIGLALAEDLKATYWGAQGANDQVLAETELSSDPVAIIEAIGRNPGLAGAAPASATTWLLLDEPERGLHRTAEAQMARGVGNRADSGLRAVLATHSPELLDTGIGDVSFVRRRSYDRPGAVVSMRDFGGVREDLGLNSSDMLRRTRGIALVEGEHDLEILGGMIGAELGQLGVEILALRGGTNLKQVVDSRFLYEFTDAVLFPILDDLALPPISELWNRVVVEARTKPASAVIEDLHRTLPKLLGKGTEFLGEFLSTSVKNGTFDRVQPLGISQTDILECLPVSAFVTEAETWEEVRETAKRSNGDVAPSETKFKAYLTKNHKSNLAPEHLRLIAATGPRHPDITALLAAIDARLSGDQTSSLLRDR